MDIFTASHRSHTAVASGYLHKLAHSGSLLAHWHQRYYVLYTDGLLYSYKSSRARLSNRVIPVGRKCLRVRFGGETRGDEATRWQRDLWFSIVNSDREFHFCCDSERDLLMWKESLLGTLDKLSSAHSSFLDRGSGTALTRVQRQGETLKNSSIVRVEARKESEQEDKDGEEENRSRESGGNESLNAYDCVGDDQFVGRREKGEGSGEPDNSSTEDHSLEEEESGNEIDTEENWTYSLL